jgi:hypothetical protein
MVAEIDRKAGPFAKIESGREAANDALFILPNTPASHGARKRRRPRWRKRVARFMGLAVLVWCTGTWTPGCGDDDGGDGPKDAGTTPDAAVDLDGSDLDGSGADDGGQGDDGGETPDSGESTDAALGVCGDGACGAGEDAANCAQDCAPQCLRLFFVAEGGDDDNPGSADLPWATLTKVSGADLLAGDCVFFQRGGQWNATLDINASGSTTHPLVFRAYGSGPRPILGGVEIHHFDHITLSDLHIVDSPHMGIDIYDGHQIIIEDTEIERSAISNIFAGPANELVVRRVSSHDALSEHGLYLCGDPLTTTDSPLVEDSVFFDNADVGIQLNDGEAQHVTNPIIRRNLIYGNRQGINNLASQNGLFHHNIIHSNTHAELYVYEDPGGCPNSSCAAVDTDFYNNIIYNHAGSVWGDIVYVGAHNSGIEFKNNIVDAPGETLVFVESGADVVLDHNCYSDGAFAWHGTSCFTFSNWVNTSGQDTNSMHADPSFVDATADFHLSPDSACVDAGTEVGLLSDFEGVSLPQGAGFDIGAYEQ